MLRISLLCVGKLKERACVALCDEYAKRLGGFCKLDIREISEKPLPERASDSQIETALRTEAAELLRLIPAGAHVTCLCIEGDRLTSEAFSARMQTQSAAHSTLCFVVGGSHGLDNTLKQAANARLSFSDMTFPHHLFRVMLLEQLYRGFSIADGRAYHK